MSWFKTKPPRFTIATLPEVEIGRVVGVARAIDGKTITAPFSGRACLAYIAKATSQRGGSGERVIAEETGGVPFHLVDPSGTALVDPDGVTCALDFERATHNSDFWGDISTAQRAFLTRYQTTHEHLASLAWREAIVVDGETIAVIGFGSRTDGQLRMASSPHLALVISDSTN